MADGEVKINTKLDTSGVDKGVKELKGKIDSAGKSIDGGTKKNKGFTDSLNGIKAGAVATAAGVAGVAVAVKKTIDVLNDCAAAYRVQKKAEEALAVAAKNNPYLNSESVYNLRNFAGELQKLSEVGDEVSMQVMAQLAATGRNEDQIMQIMSAAVDMAAATGQDIASAAQQLNATLNGNAGALGRQIAGINNLTKAELESGKAIELVAKQYKGMAAATADVEIQLTNAWGDFKENIGRGWQKVTQPVKEFFLGVLSDINEATAKTNDLKDANDARNAGKNNATQTKILLDNALAELEQAKKVEKEIGEILKDKKKLEDAFTESAGVMDEAYYKTAYKKQGEEVTNLRNKIESLRIEYSLLTTKEKEAADAAAAEATAAKKAADARARDNAAIEYIDANKKALREKIAAMQLEAETTEKVVDAGELYNIYLQSYIDLISKSNGLVSENNQAAKERLKLLEEQAKKVKEAADEQERKNEAEKLEAEAKKLVKENASGNDTYIDKYKKKSQELADLKKQLDETELKDADLKKQALEAIDEEYAQNKIDLWKNLTEEINGYTQQTADIAKQAADLMLENVKTESELELAELDEKYSKGEVSEEEYYEKQKQIKRKAAQEEYKIKMFEWSASILSATANIAEGITKAIAQGGTAGLITGALVGAAGAVNIASIIASKPTPPQFREGGVIGGFSGASYGADNIDIRARRGEMVLNAYQQRSLWDKINGQSDSAGAGLNLTVNNTQSNRVDTSIREQNGEVYIDIIDKHINKGFSDGTYDAGFAAMNSRQEGVRIL